MWTMIAKFSGQKAAIRPQIIRLKAAAAERPHFANSWCRCITVHGGSLTERRQSCAWMIIYEVGVFEGLHKLCKQINSLHVQDENITLYSYLESGSDRRTSWNKLTVCEFWFSNSFYNIGRFYKKRNLYLENMPLGYSKWITLSVSTPS